MKKNGILFISFFLFCLQSHADAILHAFNWKYNEVTAQAQAIKEAGYKEVLISPPLKSSGNQWWARYQPQDIRLIDNPLGNKEDLQKLINVMSSYGIAVYADIVLNHMANEANIRSDLNYPGTNLLSEYSQNFDYYQRQLLFGDITQSLFTSADFNPAFCITNYNDIYQVQHGRLCGAYPDTGLPDLDATENVIKQQRQYLQALKDMGIKGFRVDAVKHMDNYQINSIFTPEITNGMHVFGEVITSGGAGSFDYENFLKPYLNNSNHGAYDFPLFATIRSAFAYGGNMSILADPLSNGQALPNSKAVTFAVTHDIPTNDGFRYQILDPTDEKIAYAYILGRDGGVPLIYSDHGETSGKDGYRWMNYYNRDDIKAMIKFHNSLQGANMQIISSNSCYLLFKRNQNNGNAQGIVAINKCASQQDITVDTNIYKMYWFKNYRDVLGDNVINVQSNRINISIPARSARMWLLET